MHVPAPDPTASEAFVPTLAELGSAVEWTDDDAGTHALGAAAPGIGRLADLLEWLAGTQGSRPPRAPARPRLVSLGGFADSTAAIADAVGAGVRVIDVPAQPGAGLAAGAAAANAEIDAGADLLIVGAAGPADAATVNAAAVVISLITGVEPVALLPRGADAVDSGAWIASAARLRDARRRAQSVRNRPDDLLDAAGSTLLSMSAGVLMQAAARRTPMLLEGTSPLAAALLCQDAQSRSARWWRIADASADPVQARAVVELNQRPLLDLGTTRGDGTAGLLCLPLLRAAAALNGQAAR